MFERGGTRRWRTTERVDWYIGKKFSGWVLSIEPGREFESSTPWWVPSWVIDKDDPRLLLAALVHDVLLESDHRIFFAAGEWYDAARKSGYSEKKALAVAVAIAVRGVLKYGRRQPE